jgi:hypothetical protein
MADDNPYDKAARYAARQLNAEGFLRWVLGDILRSWRWVGWLDTRSVPFPGEPERQADTVAAFERPQGDAPPAAAVVEFQTRPLGEMPERLGEYALRIHREVPYQLNPQVRYSVVGVLLNLTGPPQGENWDMKPPDFDDLGLHLKVRVLTLRDQDAGSTLTRIDQGEVARCILAWIPLMKGASQAAIVDEWRRLASQEPNDRLRSDYGGLALIFAELVSSRLEIWQKGLEGWNVERSTVVEGWQAKARAEGEARGRAEGEARGRAEGEARGRAQMLELVRSLLLAEIRTRLQLEPPAELVAAVEAQNDPEVLRRWFCQAMQLTTLEEVRAAIGLP